MKARFWMTGVAMCLALGGAGRVQAVPYYINDTYDALNDVYATAGGNDANAGTTPGTPKATLTNLVATTVLLPNDIVYIDTGTYTPATIPNTVTGAPGSRIVFQGSTNLAAGGTVFTGSGTILGVQGRWLEVRNIRTVGGSSGLELMGASYCEIIECQAISNSFQSIRAVSGSNSNAFRRCIGTYGSKVYALEVSVKGNYFEQCVAYTTGSGFSTGAGTATNMLACIVVGGTALQSGRLSDAGSRNIFFTQKITDTQETLSDLYRDATNWTGNTYADPMFLNQGGLDFHLLSAAGFVSNGVWTTNPAVGYSPAIDFGPAGADVGAEPAPNGGRVNIGPYGGTAQASKSRTNDWLFALAFNDGGTLIRTGRLEWVGGNLGPGATVDLQYTTNNWATTNVIAAGVAATDESYAWAPAFSYPAVLWRVVSSTNPAAAATNAKAFSVRQSTNTTFVFYVNDGSTTRDVYCSAAGNNTNDGAAANRPKATLQAIVDAYQLRGGDVVHVDTGDYAGQTTTIGLFDSGSTGLPVRIVGSTNGTTFNRGNTSADVLDLSGASFLEIEHLRLTGGRYGLNGGTANITLRNTRFAGNVNGVFVTGAGHVFENCVAADNTTRAFWGSGSGANRWRNGVLWGSPTIIQAASNTLSVSNSILGRDSSGATLFGSQMVPGDFNLAWNVAPGAGYATFTAVQDAGLGWSNSLYADPLFAGAAGGDFHLKSTAGRFDTILLAFVTNDVVDSPAIDLGDPLAAYAGEPPPNGDRLNTGLFGNTVQASKSRTNAWIQLASYLDGGTLNAQEGAWVRWNAGAYDPGATITIWLSRDGGTSWEALATNVSAAAGHYLYLDPVADDTSSRLGMLKVELEGASPPAASQSPTNFTYRNGTFSFYVNDTSTTGDVYCTAAGDDANSGASPSAPMRNLHALIENLAQVGAGDRIYIDTGVYAATNTIRLTRDFSGSPTNPVVILGSTNRLAGGSRFQSVGSARPLAFDFQSNPSNIVLRDVVVSNVVRGVAMTNAVNVVLEGVEVRGATSRAFDLQGNSRSNQLLRCVAHGGGVGAYLTQATNIAIRNCVFWQNTNNAVSLGASVGVALENSVLASTFTNATLVALTATNGFASDYNGIHAGPFTRVGSRAGTLADNLAAWIRLSGGQDVHSVPGDPQMADPGSFDYHLKTEQTLGRLQPDGQRTSDSVSSPLLDAGNPASTSFTNEPAPHGDRINIGRYGGTAEASSAPDYPWIKTVSFGDAGFATNGTLPLVWTAGGGFTTETVKVEVSVDGGKTWPHSVTSGAPATNGQASWTVSGLSDTPAGAWRVVCLENTNVWAQTTNFFAIRNTNLAIYIGTADTNDNIYATGIGAADNWEATVAAPLNSLRLAFERFDLEPGDRIWVDTGVYAESSPILIGMKDTGTSNSPIRVTGNTSGPYTRTILKRTSRTVDAFGIQLAHANGIQFDSLAVTNAYTGVHLENSQAISMERIRAGYCVANAIYAGANVHLVLARSILDQNLSAGLQTFTGSVVKVENCLIRDNAQADFHIRGGDLDVRNSILEAVGTQAKVYHWGGGGRLVSDYNNIRVSDGANVAGGDNRASDRFLIDWQISTGFSNDVRSSGYEPRFADAGARDYHLKSEYGRFDPATGLYVTNDVETSRLIDLGDPASAYSNEPADNGARINVGLYGNTAEAGKSPPPGTGSLVPLTMSDGGTVRGNVSLFWAWNGFAGNEYVNILFSGDGGLTWTNIATNVYVDVGSTTGVLWRTTNYSSTAMGIWMVELAADTNVFGQTETLFAVKNDPLAYYINDGNTEGDVYCTAAGSAAGSGLSSNSPVNSLETLLNRYKVEHGDTIYVDTGIYSRSTPLVLDIPSAAATNWLVVRGSTNEAAGGSVFTNSAGSGAVIDLQSVRMLDLRDLRLHGGGRGLLFTGSSSNLITRVRAVGSRVNAFELNSSSDQNRFAQCAALHFFGTGVHWEASAEVSMTNYWRNGVIASVPASTCTLMGVMSGGRIVASNSVFVARGPADVVFSVETNGFLGDYNAYHRAGANSLFHKRRSAATFGVAQTSLEDFEAWRAWSSGDSNSFAADPLFADLDNGDLHPRSWGGRFDPATGTFVADATNSPLIDTAHPALAPGSESAPNGSRANIGLYGGTEFAGRTSPTNGSFVLLSFNQGGMARGVQNLRWIPQGEAFTSFVYHVDLQISTNSGESYPITVGTNLLATAGSFAWDTTTFPSIQTLRWRVQCREKLDWIAASERDFGIHNGPVVYYVNDAATTNDVYTSAAGSPTNTGLTAGSPLASPAEVFSRYDVEPGDILKIDTGTYVPDETIAVGFPDGGTAGEPVTIQGSTNRFGSVFSGTGFRFENVRGIQVKNLRFQSQTRPPVAEVRTSEDVLFEQFDIFDPRGSGVIISAGSNIWLRNFLVAGATTNGVEDQASFNTRLEFGTLWSNNNAQVLISSGGKAAAYVTVSNCVLGAFQPRRPIYYLAGNLSADRNCLHLGPGRGALVALQPEAAGFVREFDTVGSWIAGSGQDGSSLSHDPLFANVPAGDFHPKSSAGRFDPATGAFVADPPGTDSPLIDAGDPALACVEPDPNGSRVNIGRFANTAEASKTPAAGALTLISFNDGGQASGTDVPVIWNARGVATNATVTISYSADGGSNWVILATNVAAGADSWIWDTTLSEQSVQGKLMIEIEPTGTGGAAATSAGLFSVRNNPFTFYLNDNSTLNDVYCTAVGNNANSGLANSLPMADFNALLAKYDLESGDVVYIDTGVYRGNDPWRITQTDTAGSLTSNPVIFQGSTNSLLNGTVLDRSGNLVGIQADYAVGFQLRNIVVSNTVNAAVVFNDCYGAEAEWVVAGPIDGGGFSLNQGSQLRLDRCLALGGSWGIDLGRRNSALLNVVFPVVENCVVWGGAGTAIQMNGNQATVRHSILAVDSGQYVYDIGPNDVLTSDYNAIRLPDGARMLLQPRSGSVFPNIYETLGVWAAASGNDLHSFDSDPLLADPDAWDFHPQSRVGRYDPGSETWVQDAVSSPLIDAGDPATVWTNEPEPNGRRVNIGLFGGTHWASQSDTNFSALYILTLNRGGVASGQVVLNWMAAGLATGHTVRVEVSIDGGATWTRVASGIPASLGGLLWNSSSLPASPLAYWRVQDEDEPGVEATSELPFVLHNGAVHYYVNDGSVEGDIFCSAAGSAMNTGASADSPKRWVSDIVETYNLEPGDIIHVDTGDYPTPTATTFGELDAGGLAQDPAQQVNVVGSTNGSTYILLDPALNGFELNSTYGIRFSRLGIVSGSNGLAVSGSQYIAGDELNIRACFNGVASAGSSSNLVLTRSTLVGNQNAGISVSGSRQNNANIDGCVLWTNRYGLYLRSGGQAFISNSIVGMTEPETFGIYAIEGGAVPYGLQSDYNNLYVGHARAAAAGLQTGVDAFARTSVYASVSAWAQASGQDVHSLPHDPLLVDPDNGDYHLKSAGGRYLPGTGWVYDTMSSPLIDMGDPGSMTWTAEPNPNGRRLNIGLYGGTAEASKTPLDGWITLLALNDGGTASGVFPLTWAVGGAATNYTICIEFSSDNGATWTNQLVCGWPAVLGSWTWNSVPYGRTALGRWRAYCLENDEIRATSFAPFVLRNEGFIPFYVNDSSTTGDVYCTAIGDDANDGLTRATPKATLQAILDTYDLDPSDIVYVDAGTYLLGAPVKIDQTDSGWSNLYVTIQGSTNPAAPSLFSAVSFSVASVFSLEYAVNVRIKDLTLQQAAAGVALSQTIGCEFDGVRIQNNRGSGMNFSQAASNRLARSILWNNSTTGGVAIALSQSQIAINNCVLWGSPASISFGNSGATISNSVLYAKDAEGLIYQLGAASPSAVRADYNSYTRLNGALFGRKSNLIGADEIYNNLPGWSAASSSDYHSMTFDPGFANSTNGDFHARSPEGRFTLGGWVKDTSLSPLVDAGAPGAVCTNEPAPNGGYVNLGAYGNTPQASLTQTNPWLRAVSYNEQSIVTGNVLLYWLHGGMPSNALVRLEYSTDYQVSWKPIASNLPAASREYLWNVGALPLSLALNWRVVYQGDPGVWDASDEPVQVKPGVYDYYVNDASTTGDVWCLGPGTAPGYGANPTNRAFPIDSLTSLLANYPVGAGDRVFVDTGTYPATVGSPIVLGSLNLGTVSAPLKIYGSTNFQAGGALLAGNNTRDGITIQNTGSIELYDLRIANASHGLVLRNSSAIVLEGLELFNNASNGIWNSGSQMTLRRGRLWGNRQYGYTDSGGKGAEILRSTLWGNRLGAVWLSMGVVVSNSILCVTNAAPIFYENSLAASVSGDYNLYGLATGNVISSNKGEQVDYVNLRDWQAKGRDAHSLLVDPLFMNPAAGDFHLQSRAGYWSNGVLVVSTNTSWGIDAGDPSATASTNEPPPNGGRLNLGAYGGTTNAARSDTNNPALLAVSFRDGGTFSAGEPLFWVFRGIQPTNTVRIEYSPDGGLTWLNVDSQVRVDSAPYVWYPPVDATATPEAWWRVVLEANTNVWDDNGTNFTFRPVPLRYFVNDASQSGDIYTTAVGSPTNRGYVSNSPLHSVQAVLERFQLAGGDEIRVDTGVYTLSNSVFLSLLSGGDTTNRAKITGSTNQVAGRSWLQAAPGMTNPAFFFFGAHDIDVSNFRLTGFPQGASFSESSARCTLFDLDIQGSTGPGVSIGLGIDIRLERVLIREGASVGLSAGSPFSMDGCVLWSNRYSAISLGGGAANISNSVIEASGAGQYCYSLGTGAIVNADFNDLFVREGAQIANVGGLAYEKLPQWVRANFHRVDRHSLSTDPLFHDPDNGDFHPRSVAGRYALGTGWEQDVPEEGLPDFSPLIDMGSTNSVWTNEPAANGGRRNIGLYGNTHQASKSDSDPWLQAITAMSGGLAYGGFHLTWGYGGGIQSNALVQLDYSRDNGNTWLRIDSTLAGAGEYFWQSDLKLSGGGERWPTSPGARWRIFLLNNTNVWDMTDLYFGLRNSPFKYYLNDESTLNDVYCASNSIGSDTNFGFLESSPKLTLTNLLAEVDLEPTDILYVDTGIYPFSPTNEIQWDSSDGGEEGLPIQWIGSTHSNGSWFVSAVPSLAGSFKFDAGYINLYNLNFVRAGLAFNGNGTIASNLWVTNGFIEVAGSQSTLANTRLDRGGLTVAGEDILLDRFVQRWGATTLVGDNMTMRHSVVYTTNNQTTALVVNVNGAVVSNCTVVASGGTAVGKLGNGILRLGHNILVAGGSDANSVIAWLDGVLISDWNNLFARDSAWIGFKNGKWEKLAYWQAPGASGQDANSVSFDPAASFQNEADGDFHLNSTRGRWSPLLDRWDTDTVHSVLIDLGDPWSGTASEPSPNGYRRNLGAFGGTQYASKSRTNFWLTALTANDGGVLKGSNVVLRWAVSNNAPGTVRLEYSADGVTWTNIATGVAATAGSYVWDTTTVPDGFYAYWRVVDEDSGIADTNDAPFALRNTNQFFYVNDGVDPEDIYTSVAGSNANDGLTPATPKAGLQAILDTYDLEGGDEVFLDTGTYATNADLRVIWSRGGDPNADVVIRGNPNSPYATVLERTGSGASIALDVKASHLQLRDFNVTGAACGIQLESNRNVSVRGIVASDVGTGLEALAAQGTDVRNSAFWKTTVGVSLQNTRTSTLENLTFALQTEAGIKLNSTVADTLRNNIFIPATNAYAYSIGGATSLLAQANMDYNLYDFSRSNTGFYVGATNYYSGPTNDPLRRWQIGDVGKFPGMSNDFRSAIAPADLADVEFTGDFHPLSPHGRWLAEASGGDWTYADTNMSWAVDHGDPEADYSQEPEDDGNRVNIGMYGNTPQASRGTTNVFLEIRTLNEPALRVSQNDQVWPMIWSAHMVDCGERVDVQFSGDNGASWITLTNVDVCQEYYVWQATIDFSTGNGLWRVIGAPDTNLVGQSDNPFVVQYRDLGIFSRPYVVSGLVRFEWEGGIQGRRYEIRYSDDFGKTWQLWDAKYNGPATINKSNFIIPPGGSQLYYTFEDRTSYLRRQRWYRIYQFDPSEE